MHLPMMDADHISVWMDADHISVWMNGHVLVQSCCKSKPRAWARAPRVHSDRWALRDSNLHRSKVRLLDVLRHYTATFSPLYRQHVPKNVVRPRAKTPPIAVSISPKISPVCPNCGDATTHGERSCCARGGAWFKKCGDGGDAKFEHTWTEGIQACTSKFCHAF